jgi:hypothetical protein
MVNNILNNLHFKSIHTSVCILYYLYLFTRKRDENTQYDTYLYFLERKCSKIEDRKTYFIQNSCFLVYW